MNKPQLHDLARAGAQARLAAIEQERSALLALFPELGGGRRGRAGKAAAAESPAGARPRRKGKMSAEARRAVSERMRAYWAARRGEKQPDGEAAAETDGSAPRRGRGGRRKGGRKK